eukprot:scaffold57229_cov55-Attheya_sp.AAC.3
MKSSQNGGINFGGQNEFSHGHLLDHGLLDGFGLGRGEDISTDDGDSHLAPFDLHHCLVGINNFGQFRQPGIAGQHGHKVGGNGGCTFGTLQQIGHGLGLGITGTEWTFQKGCKLFPSLASLLQGQQFLVVHLIQQSSLAHYHKGRIVTYHTCNPKKSNGGQCSIELSVVTKDADDIIGVAAADTHYLLLML